MTPDAVEAAERLHVKGMVFDVQSFSIHDGPGIRTTVFLKGCPLRCAWCHNPESWARESQISWTPRLCIGCGACIAVCPTGSHRVEDGVHLFDREVCNACGKCVAVCPSKALELTGQLMTVAQAMEPVLADIQFFTESGGGMTVSGGEPLMQADFTAALLATARAAGIHTAVETSGAGRPQDLEKVARQADLVLYDIKAAPVDYQRLTGADYDRTLGNLRRIKQAGGKLWFRLPLVPGINDTQAHFQNIAKLAAEFQPERVDMVPYHTLGVDKRRRFGMPDAALPDLPSAEKNQVDQWAATLRALGVAVWVPGT